MTTIVMDTREKIQKKQEILLDLESLGMKVVRSKLYVGDWTLLDDMSVCVDTKQNMAEVYSNLVQQHKRFRDECIRARDAGIQLVVLIEDPNIKDVSGVHTWDNPRIRRWKKTSKALRAEIPPVSSDRIESMMRVFETKYDVRWRFCLPGKAGEEICVILLGI